MNLTHSSNLLLLPKIPEDCGEGNWVGGLKKAASTDTALSILFRVLLSNFKLNIFEPYITAMILKSYETFFCRISKPFKILKF
jgi:hypothetical protein